MLEILVPFALCMLRTEILSKSIKRNFLTKELQDLKGTIIPDLSQLRLKQSIALLR